MKEWKTFFSSGFNGQNMVDGKRKKGICKREVKKLMCESLGFLSDKLA